MPRARGRVPAHARHRKVIKAAKGFYGRRKNTFRTAQAAVVKAGVNTYKGRKQKKRNFRSLWIQRINAAVRAVDDKLTYSRFIDGLAGDADGVLATAAIALRLIQNPLVLGTGGNTTLDTGHSLAPQFSP